MMRKGLDLLPAEQACLAEPEEIETIQMAQQAD